ncbi:MAG: TonB-dependent receptor [Pseudomonadota bacterium]
MEEVMVTAQKREQALSDVPITIQAVSGEFLNDQNIKNLREFVNFVPGMSQGATFSTEQARYQLRSITQDAGDPTVGYYIDDAPYYYPENILAPVIRTVGIDRIEVLKGPQSTLYGNGAMGGVVRVIPKAPNLEEFEGSVLVGYTDMADGDSGHTADLSVSIPLIKDKLAARFTVGDEERGGWIDLQPHEINFATFAYEPVGDPIENFGGTEIRDYRLQVLAEPTEKLTLKFMAIRNEVLTEPAGQLQIGVRPPTSTDANPNSTGMENEYDFLAATLIYEFEQFSLTSAFTGLDYEDRYDSSFISQFGLPIVVTQAPESFSNETRLVSNMDGRWQWIAGIYYVDSENEQFIEVPPFPAFGTPAISQTSLIESEQLSVFGEVSYELIEGKLTGLFGLRYFEDDRTWTEEQSILSVPLDDVNETFDSINPRFNLAYTPDEDSLYFLNIAKGFRSGIVNPVSRCLSIPAESPLFANCLEPIDSDELWSYELGIKRTFQDGRLLFDATFYYQDWQDYQGAVATGTISTSASFGDADGVGVDFSVSWSPESVPGLTLLVAANWNNMEFSDLRPAVVEGFGGLVEEGDEIPGAPTFSSAVSVGYGRQLSSSLFGQFSVSWNHVNEHTTTAGSVIPADDRDYLNARASLTLNETLGLHIYGTNLTDDDGVIYGSSIPGGPNPYEIVETPRLWGVELSYDF